MPVRQVAPDGRTLDIVDNGSPFETREIVVPEAREHEATDTEMVTADDSGINVVCTCGWIEGPFDTTWEARAHADAHTGKATSVDEAMTKHQAADAEMAAVAEAEAEEKAQVEADALSKVEQLAARVDALEAVIEQPVEGVAPGAP